MRALIIDYILEHGRDTSRWKLSMMLDEELLRVYNETRDVVESLLRR